MSGYNLPPGCSQRDIDAVFGTEDDLDACFEPDEEPTEPEEEL